jgi:hypothetical protein
MRTGALIKVKKPPKAKPPKGPIRVREPAATTIPKPIIRKAKERRAIAVLVMGAGAACLLNALAAAGGAANGVLCDLVVPNIIYPVGLFYCSNYK